MKTSVLLVFLMVICASKSEDLSSHISVVCTSENAATVTITGTDLTLKSTDPSCANDLTSLASDTYTLTQNCIPGKQILLMEKTETTFDTQSLSFQVTCQGDDGVIATPQAILKFNQSPTSIIGTIIPPAKPNMKLIISKSAPLNNDTIDTFKTAASPVAFIGETIHLSLIDGTGADAYFIPLMCHASVPATSSTAANAVLWQLNANDPVSGKGKCFRETAVVAQNKFEKIGSFLSLQMTAFKFTANEAGDITFECIVRACASDSGTCKSDKTTMNSCLSGTDRISRRRRREADDDVKSHENLHRVTSTLRVISNVIEYGTAGTTTIIYSLPCLLLSLLSKVIL